ncbi:nitroreductase [Sphingomonas sp. CL5.1]|nr:nitroreductase [Sphingomonas sp. CL5.1]
MTATPRTSTSAVAPLFLHRWSPRAFDGSAMPDANILTILDAGRWAPSAFNYQPWRFIYAQRDHPEFDHFLSLLLPFNRDWACRASLLIVFVSECAMNDSGNPSHTHSFDAGAAWAQIALQATLLGYHAHAMTGIDFDLARSLLNIPAAWRIEAAAAIGRRAAPDILPEKLRAREAPSDRKPLSEIATAASFRVAV